MKCGQALRTSPGLLVAGQTAGSVIAPQGLAPAKRVVQPGGFFPRLIAVIVDGLLLSVIVVPVIYLWAGQQTAHVSSGSQGNVATDVFRSVGGAAVAQYSADQLSQLLALLIGLQILALFYYAGTWSILGGSPGQLLMSLRIVDANARTLGFGRALLRYIVKGLLGILAPVSALMVAFGRDKRAIHDLLAGTFVIQFLDPTAADLPPAQPAVTDQALPPAMPPAPPAPIPEPAYAGAAVAAAVSEATPVAPAPAPAEPPLAAPPPPPPAPEPSASAFETYSAPSAEVRPAPPEASPPNTSPPETSPPPAAVPELAPHNPAERPPAALPVFPTGQPGELQPMAPRPAEPLSQTARPPAPAAEQRTPPTPYALPFMPAPPPPDPPTPPPPPAPED